MERLKETITVYRNTLNKVNEQVTKAADTYKRFTVHKVNLGNQRVTRLNELFEVSQQWLQYYPAKVDDLNLKLSQTFRLLEVWLGDWYKAENQNAGSQRNRLPELDRRLNDCFVAVLQVFLYNGNESKGKVNEVSKKIIEFGQFHKFPQMICEGLEQIVNHACPFGRPWVDIETLVNDYMGDHFNLFMPNGLNRILLEELKIICNLETNIIFLSQVPDFISCIYGNYESFRKVVNRNFLYNLIAQGLEKKGVGYPNLIDMQSDEVKEYYEEYQRYLEKKAEFQTELQDDEEFREFSPPNECESKVRFKLIITETVYQSYLNREYMICPFGLPESRRYMRDFLITFGKDSTQEFSNDISLPNLNDVDSIFAIMYINKEGLFLMDMSSKSVINMKLMVEQEIKLRNNQVIVMGNNHQFLVNIEKGIFMNDMRIDRIKLSSFDDCQSTRTIVNTTVDEENPLIIGKGPECQFRIDSDDISEKHAKIYFNPQEQSFMLKDLGQGSSTSYKLKTKNQIINGKPSKPKKLENNQVFFIEDFRFLVKIQE